MNKNKYIRLLELENSRLNRLIKDMDDMDNACFKALCNVRTYAKHEVDLLSDTISDYMDDDYEANRGFIADLMEDREHWSDIVKICERDFDNLYMKDHLI